MSNTPEILFPIDDHLMRLEPVVFLENGVYVKTRGADQEAAFVTSRGAASSLRKLISRDAFDDHFARRNAASICAYLQTVLDDALYGSHADELRYFAEHLLPSLAERDWSTRFSLESGPSAVPGFFPSARSGVLDSVSKTIPSAFLPTPSVLLLGRFRSLQRVTRTGFNYHVRHGPDVLEPTGSEVPMRLLENGWRADVRAWLARSQARLTECNPAGAESNNLSGARAQIAREGFFQQGDVLYLPGSPPHVGHMLPPHFNRTMGRDSCRDLAMVAPFILPPRIVAPQVYTKTSDRRWVPLRLPNGLCLGQSAPEIRPENPGLALLAFLRWAAARVAANGMFHSSDEHVASAYDS